MCLQVSIYVIGNAQLGCVQVEHLTLSVTGSVYVRFLWRAML